MKRPIKRNHNVYELLRRKIRGVFTFDSLIMIKYREDNDAVPAIKDFFNGMIRIKYMKQKFLHLRKSLRNTKDCFVDILHTK